MTVKKRFIYICSPCRGDYEKNIQQAGEYCREIMTLFPFVVPIAPHVYFTQFLDDTKPSERSLGMEAGLALLNMCDEMWVYGADNPSQGMKAEIEYAKEHRIPIRDATDVYKRVKRELYRRPRYYNRHHGSGSNHTEAGAEQ